MLGLQEYHSIYHSNFIVGVRRTPDGTHYRANTNDEKFYLEFIHQLEWKRTPEEAQKDLDALAINLQMKKYKRL